MSLRRLLETSSSSIKITQLSQAVVSCRFGQLEKKIFERDKEDVGISVSTNGKESTVNRALGGSIYPG
jgi:ribosome-associated translation inhibitor RaiA